METLLDSPNLQMPRDFGKGVSHVDFVLYVVFLFKSLWLLWGVLLLVYVSLEVKQSIFVLLVINITFFKMC